MKNIPEEIPPLRSWVGPPAPPSFATGFELDYEALFKRLIRNWYWFALFLILTVGLAWLKLRYTIPIYSASASMLVEQPAESNAGLSKDVIAQELGFEASYNIENELYVLRSRHLMERVVNLMGLDISYTHIGRVKETEIYRPQIFSLVPADTLFLPVDEPIRYGSAQIRMEDEQHFSLIRGENDTIPVQFGTPFPIGNRNFTLQQGSKINDLVPKTIYRINAMNPTHVAARYANNLSVSQNGQSGVVTLRITDQVPKKAKDLLDRLVDVYGVQIIERQSKTGEQTLSFIEERLAFVTKELYAVEYNVASFRQEQGMSVDLATRGADYLTQLNTVDAQLAELQVRIELIENMRRILLVDSVEFRTLPMASEVISGVLTQLIQEYNQLVFERDQKLEVFTAEHPNMATFTEQLISLRKSILQSINTILRETNERASQIKQRIRPLEDNMNRIPENERKLVQIMRQQQIKESLFNFLLQKREEAALTVAAQVPNTRIIDRATASSVPISPNKTMIYLFAICIGLFIPSSTIFARELLGTKVTTEREIKKSNSSPIIGRITKGPKSDTIIVNKENRSGLAEAFRLLRTNLGFLLPRGAASVFLVTSSVSGEGKTFISANLGATFSIARKRVVILELDMRKPKLGKTVQGKKFDRNAPGVSNFLIDRSDYDSIIQETSVKGLSMIQSGPIPPNPAELLLSEKMQELMQRLRKDFDIIILDMPPVGIVTDALIMKNEADITLFVTRLRVTPKKSLEMVNELVKTGKLPRLNLVINGLNPKDHYGYGYGYYK